MNIPCNLIPPIFTGSAENDFLPFPVPVIGKLLIPEQLYFFLKEFPAEVPDYELQNWQPFVQFVKQLKKLEDGLFVNECGELFDTDAESHIANLQKELEALNLDKVFMVSFLIGWVMRQKDPDACKWSETFHLQALRI